MPKEFLKPLLWAIGLHGGVLGILLFSWPFLAQSVFPFDQYRIIKVSLVSPHLSSLTVLGEAQKNSSSGRFKNRNPPPTRTPSNQPVPESTSSLGESPIMSGEDLGEKKEPSLGIAFPSPGSQIENTLREKGNGGQTPPGGIGKEPLVAFSSTKKSAAGSTLAVPRYGQNREPYYPATAREQGWQGTTVLKVLVLKNGSVGSLEVWRSSGFTILDRSALKGVKEWKFISGQKDGQPTEMWVQIPVTFRLE